MTQLTIDKGLAFFQRVADQAESRGTCFKGIIGYIKMMGKYFTNTYLRISTPAFKKSMVLFHAFVLIPIPLIAAPAVTQAANVTAYADQNAYAGGYLNSRINGVSDCHIIFKSDGPHLILTLRAANTGNAIQVQNDETNYDYIFHPSSRKTDRPAITSNIVKKTGIIDITINTATGLRRNTNHWKIARKAHIFNHPGHYVLLIGYGFQSSDEAEIDGVCEINYNTPQR